LRTGALLALALLTLFVPVSAQKKRVPKHTSKSTAKAPTELEKLRDAYINATKDYKTSLEKLLPLYEKGLITAKDKAEKSKELLAQGLISKREAEASDRAVEAAPTVRSPRRWLRSSLKSRCPGCSEFPRVECCAPLR
jgi:hypothetical protein